MAHPQLPPSERQAFEILATSRPCPQPPAKFAGREPGWPLGGRMSGQPEGFLHTPEQRRPLCILGLPTAPPGAPSLGAPATVLVSLLVSSPLDSGPCGVVTSSSPLFRGWRTEEQSGYT